MKNDLKRVFFVCHSWMTNRNTSVDHLTGECDNVKKALEFCNIFMWVTIGGFIGKALATFLLFSKYEDVLESISRHWYDELIVPLIYTVVIVAILIVVIVILKKKMTSSDGPEGPSL